MAVFQGKLYVSEGLLTADEIMTGLGVLGANFFSNPIELSRDDTENLGMLLLSLSQLASLSQQIRSQMEDTVIDD